MILIIVFFLIHKKDFPTIYFYCIRTGSSGELIADIIAKVHALEVDLIEHLL